MSLYGFDAATPVAETYNNITSNALQVSSDGCNAISNIIADIQDDNRINETTSGKDGVGCAKRYGVVISDLDISTAAGAMVVDDLMQKISTEVQVAAQMLSTANNLNKTAARILSQG